MLKRARKISSVLIWRIIEMSKYKPCAQTCARISIAVFALIVAGFLFAEVATRSHAENGQTRLLRAPTVSATQIAFAYANNIWVVPRSGGMARRVTSFQGQTTNP